jgi:molybdate transport system permease protein
MRLSFQALGETPMEVAATLGASPLAVFMLVALPQCRRGMLTAAVLTFAHTIGEFGVVLMIGGAIPGKTEVVSIRIYELVEALRFDQANRLAAGLVVFAFLVLLSLFLAERRFGGARPQA